MWKPLFPRWRKGQIERLTIAHSALVTAHTLLKRGNWGGAGSVMANIDVADEVITELFNFVEAKFLAKLENGPPAAPQEAQLEHDTQPGLEQNPDPQLTKPEN
jgi:hypothetical protein